MPSGPPTPTPHEKKKATITAIVALLQHDDLLPASLVEALRGFSRQLSATMHPIEQLDAHKKMLDEKFPDWEHWYILCGDLITWCDRPRKQRQA